MTLTLVNLADQDAALPFPWSRIKRTLDSLEARFVRSGLRLQAERVQALRPVVEEALRRGLVPATINLEGNFLDLVEAYVGQVLVEGIVQGDADVRAEERRARAAGVNLKVDGEAVIPKEAIAFLESRRDLNRFFDADQVEKVRTILGNSLREGATVKQTMDALQTALPGASRARLENIARTEATAAYNQGRVYRFLQSKGFIQAVRFDAILDSRVTDICQHRNGLLFALDDPRLRQNTPPLHYQCRSVLTPISGYKLEKMGGKARLDADRAKMDDAPGPQVTKTGRFGNEPWPDVQGGGGAAPMPRAKPVGPKGPGQGKPGPKAEAEPVPAPSGPKTAGPKGPREGEAEKGKVASDPAAKGSGRYSGPTLPDGKIDPPQGVRIAYAPGVSPDNQVIREVFWTIGKLPEEVQKVLRQDNVSIVFGDANPFDGPRPSRIPESEWQAHRKRVENRPAFVLTGLSEEDSVTLYFRPSLLAGDDVRWAALHETGHAVYRTLKLDTDLSVVEAYLAEASGRPLNSQINESEFVADGFAWYHTPNMQDLLWLEAPKLYAIVDERMAMLRNVGDKQVLFQGKEGAALYNPTDNLIAMSIDVGQGKIGALYLYEDGTMVCFGGGATEGGAVKIGWSTQRDLTPEEAEPYKAFLRSKGVTLPHVMP